MVRILKYNPFACLYCMIAVLTEASSGPVIGLLRAEQPEHDRVTSFFLRTRKRF